MKKLILSLIGVVFAFAATSQVVVRGVSPEAIANNFAFEWADPAGWRLVYTRFFNTEYFC